MNLVTGKGPTPEMLRPANIHTGRAPGGAFVAGGVGVLLPLVVVGVGVSGGVSSLVLGGHQAQRVPVINARLGARGAGEQRRRGTINYNDGRHSDSDQGDGRSAHYHGAARPGVSRRADWRRLWVRGRLVSDCDAFREHVTDGLQSGIVRETMKVVSAEALSKALFVLRRRVGGVGVLSLIEDSGRQ